MAKKPKLTELQKRRLSFLEPALKVAARSGNLPQAKEIVSDIQNLLRPTGHETRLKIWLFEAAMEAGDFGLAIPGLMGVRKKMAQGTRTHIEATVLLAICHIRQKDLKEAEPFITQTMNSKRFISPEVRRRAFIRAVVQRFEEEAVLAGIAGQGSDLLDISAVQEEAGQLIASRNEDDIYALIGSNLPLGALGLFESVQIAARKQLSAREQLYLSTLTEEREKRSIGKTAFSALKRVLWTSLCDASSDTYKLWFNEGIQAAVKQEGDNGCNRCGVSWASNRYLLDSRFCVSTSSQNRNRHIL
jgi:hypothetical protein